MNLVFGFMIGVTKYFPQYSISDYNSSALFAKHILNSVDECSWEMLLGLEVFSRNVECLLHPTSICQHENPSHFQKYYCDATSASPFHTSSITVLL